MTGYTGAGYSEMSFMKSKQEKETFPYLCAVALGF
jgi:hypothetical protein